MKHAKANIFLGLAVFGIGAGFLVMSARNEMTSEFGPGPGLFPSSIAVLIMLLGGLHAITSRQRSAARASGVSGTSSIPWARFAIASGISLCYAFLFSTIGYFLSSVVGLCAILLLFGNGWKSFLIAPVGAIIYYVAFIELMGTYDPGGQSLMDFLQGGAN